MDVLVSELPPLYLHVLGFLFGSFWGSFWNVAIYRWPREMSVVHPPSHCPACGTPIPPWRNVPVFGYLVLRGRAACCGAKMSPRYLMVEIIGGALGLAMMHRFVVLAEPDALLLPAMLEAAIYFTFLGGLVIATFVDLEHMIIPDEVSLGGLALGLATLEVRGGPTAAESALGAGAAYLGVQLVFGWAYETALGRRGMGEGDAKLLAMIGAFTGWQGALFALLGGAFQGTLISLVAMAAKLDLRPAAGRDEFAFDPGPHVAGRGNFGCEDSETTESAADSETTESAADSETTESAADSETTESASESESVSQEDDLVAAETSGLRAALPFGPFIVLAALEWFFFGEQIYDAYVALLLGE